MHTLIVIHIEIVLLHMWTGIKDLKMDLLYQYTERYSALFITPHVQCERGKVIGCGVHIYVCGRKKYLKEIDSPFQTFAVGLLVEFID